MQDTPHNHVYPAVVYQLGFSRNSFPHEAQPLRDRAAPVIPGAALDDHPVQVEIKKQIVQHCRHCAGDDATPLVLRGEPITQAASAIPPIDGMTTYGSRERSFQPDAALRTAIVQPLRCHYVCNKLADIRGGPRALDPRQPLTQIAAVVVDHWKDDFRIGRFQKLDCEGVTDLAAKNFARV